MRVILLAITVSILFSGCSDSTGYKSTSQKIKYDLINEVLNQYVFIPSGEDVRPVMYTGCIYQNLPGKSSIENFRIMLDNVGNPFTGEDIEYMKWQLEKEWNRKINRSMIDNYNITVLKEKRANFGQACNSMLLYLSSPLFSLDKEHALIWQSLEYKELSAGFILILEKQKNRWILTSYDITNFK